MKTKNCDHVLGLGIRWIRDIDGDSFAKRRTIFYSDAKELLETYKYDIRFNLCPLCGKKFKKELE